MGECHRARNLFNILIAGSRHENDILTLSHNKKPTVVGGNHGNFQMDGFEERFVAFPRLPTTLPGNVCITIVSYSSLIDENQVPDVLEKYFFIKKTNIFFQSDSKHNHGVIVAVSMTLFLQSTTTSLSHVEKLFDHDHRKLISGEENYNENNDFIFFTLDTASGFSQTIKRDDTAKTSVMINGYLISKRLMEKSFKDIKPAILQLENSENWVIALDMSTMREKNNKKFIKYEKPDVTDGDSVTSDSESDLLTRKTDTDLTDDTISFYDNPTNLTVGLNVLDRADDESIVSISETDSEIDNYNKIGNSMINQTENPVDTINDLGYPFNYKVQ